MMIYQSKVYNTLYLSCFYYSLNNHNLFCNLIPVFLIKLIFFFYLMVVYCPFDLAPDN